MNDVFSQRRGPRLPLRALAAIAMLAVPFLCLGQATIAVVAGTGNPPINPGAIGDGGPAKNAFLDGPDSVTVDPAGNLYIRERARVRKVTPAGIISTVAGNGTNGFSGDGGLATSAQLGLAPQRAGLATDSAGNLYIADTVNSRIRKVDTSGKISTVAGNGQSGLGSPGDGGQATNEKLCFPAGVAVDRANNLFFGSSICGGVRKVDPSGIITTVGRNSAGPSYGVAVDDSGNLYLNANTLQILKVSANGTITPIAGAALTSGSSGDGGPATSAKLFEVDGIAVDKAGNIFIADSGNGRIRMVDTAGIITTVAGHGTVGPGLGCPNLFSTGCPATNLKFGPSDVALDASGNLYTVNFIGGLVYKISGVPISTGPNPTISANGVVNGASFGPGIAPNSFATIFGTNLAPKTDDWGASIVNGKLPPSLDGVSVSIGGKPAYVSFISPGQLNVLVPNLGPGAVSVTVTTPSGVSAAVTATVGQSSPAFFPFPGSQPVATRQDFTFAAKAGTFPGLTTIPAAPGDVIILWGTGFGPTSPAAPVGVQVPSDQLYSTSTPVAVKINNIDATVYGAALAPGFAGLYQVAIQVPPTLADGDWPVQATIGGVTSPAGTVLSVRR
jgi:uncharacterized protein (TIGR03437 family)